MNPLNTDSNTTSPRSTPDEQTEGSNDNIVSGSILDTNIHIEDSPQTSDESKPTDGTEYTAPDISSTAPKHPIDTSIQEANTQEISPTALPQINKLSAAQAAEILKDREQLRRSPMINLLKINGEEPAQAAPAPQEPIVAPPVAPKQSKKLLITAITVAMIIVVSTSAYFFSVNSQNPSVVVDISPTPTITPTPSETPTTTPTPVATPAQASTPATVTVPTITPTTDHPQMVTVQAKSGLWLRSSPTSINQNNVIGWMPNNAQVSVDQIGDFWWHGTYAGKTGYFASKFTQ